MSKLSELVSAAKAATPGPWRKTCHGVVVADKGTGNTDDDYIVMWDDTPEHVETDATFIALANPATILELCTLLEKAEDALKVMARTTSCNYAGVPEALAAIKQWKEQT